MTQSAERAVSRYVTCMQSQRWSCLHALHCTAACRYTVVGMRPTLNSASAVAKAHSVCANSWGVKLWRHDTTLGPRRPHNATSCMDNNRAAIDR